MEGISGGEVSVRAMEFRMESPFLVRAILDVVGRWTLRRFSRFSLVHLVLACLRQCFFLDPLQMGGSVVEEAKKQRS